MKASPRPLAVALVDVTGLTPSQQAAARRQVLDTAHTEGYELQEVLELGAGGPCTQDVHAAAIALASRADAAAFVVHGDVDQAQLDRAAGDLTLPVITIPTTGPLASSSTSSGTGARDGSPAIVEAAR